VARRYVRGLRARAEDAVVSRPPRGRSVTRRRRRRFIETVPRRGYRFIAPVEGAGLTAERRSFAAAVCRLTRFSRMGHLLPPSRPSRSWIPAPNGERLGATLATRRVAVTAVVVLGLSWCWRLPRSSRHFPHRCQRCASFDLSAMSGFEAGWALTGWSPGWHSTGKAKRQVSDRTST
jgi:hypothetical protein